MNSEPDNQTTALMKTLMGGYDEEQLKAAFKAVQNPDDWKAPIETIIEATEEEIDMVEFAITFYTASPPTISKQPDGRWYVASAGYRMGPAGP